MAAIIRASGIFQGRLWLYSRQGKDTAGPGID
jgi:hypothetical protein